MYSVVEISDPQTGEVIHVCRQSGKTHWNHSCRRLIQEARSGLVGYRFDRTRAIRLNGKDPVCRFVSEALDKRSANKLVDELRTNYGLVYYKRELPYKRVHQQADLDSPDLDPTPVYYVYELIRPDTDKVFYVGKGSDRHRPRIDAHVRKAKQGKKGHKFSVIRKLLRAGLLPTERRIAEGLTESESLKLEVEHIRSIGLTILTNEAPGGQSPPTGDDHWTRRYPEKVLRGEKHPWAKDPELAERCKKKMQAALKADPSKRPRGAKHGMSKLGRAQVDAIRKLYQEGIESGNRITGRQLAGDFEVTPAQISRVLRGESWGLPALIKKHGNAKLSHEQVNEIKARRGAGESYVAIARAFGVTTNAIFSHCNPGPSKRKNTTGRPGNAKLTPAQIEEMVDRNTQGESRKQLAADFEVSYSQVWRILKKQQANVADACRC